jgi:hypothetical protein
MGRYGVVPPGRETELVLSIWQIKDIFASSKGLLSLSVRGNEAVR